ncbi:MAG: molybdopterin-dependent oxidoreductase [Bacteriovoracia bacterium]
MLFVAGAAGGEAATGQTNASRDIAFLKSAPVEIYWRGLTATSALPIPLSGIATATLKVRQTSERDAAGKSQRWEGLQLSALINEAMEKLTLVQKSEVDLVIFKHTDGQETSVPRWFIQKYGLLLAFWRNGEGLGPANGGPVVVLPWSTHGAAIGKEVLPIERYTAAGIREIELTNYRVCVDAGYFLKRRTNPVVVRGEKTFLQTCMGCHLGKPLPAMADMQKTFSPEGVARWHAQEKRLPAWSTQDYQGLQLYMKEVLGDAVAAQ